MLHTCVAKAHYFLSAKTHQTYQLFLGTCLLQPWDEKKVLVYVCALLNLRLVTMVNFLIIRNNPLLIKTCSVL